MDIEEISKRMFCDIVLVIMKSSGVFSRRYFWSYEDMEDYAIYLQFSPNIKKAKGLYRKNGRWVTYFTLG